MGIKKTCNGCDIDLSEQLDLGQGEIIKHELNLNGKVFLCSDCYIRLANFVNSGDFKNLVVDEE